MESWVVLLHVSHCSYFTYWLFINWCFTLDIFKHPYLHICGVSITDWTARNLFYIIALSCYIMLYICYIMTTVNFILNRLSNYKKVKNKMVFSLLQLSRFLSPSFLTMSIYSTLKCFQDCSKHVNMRQAIGCLLPCICHIILTKVVLTLFQSRVL